MAEMTQTSIFRKHVEQLQYSFETKSNHCNHILSLTIQRLEPSKLEMVGIQGLKLQLEIALLSSKTFTIFRCFHPYLNWIRLHVIHRGFTRKRVYR